MNHYLTNTSILVIVFIILFIGVSCNGGDENEDSCDCLQCADNNAEECLSNGESGLNLNSYGDDDRNNSIDGDEDGDLSESEPEDGDEDGDLSESEPEDGDEDGDLSESEPEDGDEDGDLSESEPEDGDEDGDLSESESVDGDEDGDLSESEPVDGDEDGDLSESEPEDGDEDGDYDSVEVEPFDPCADLTCGENALCQVADQQASCVCMVGFEGDPFASCSKIPGCEVDNGGCDPLTVCADTVEGPICGLCPQGFMGDGISGCFDINECQYENGGCDELAGCTNIIGSYFCGECPDGYEGDGYSGCSQIDVCNVDNGGCDPIVSCTSKAGQPVCGSCPDDYSGDGYLGCQPILSKHASTFTVLWSQGLKMRYYRNHPLSVANEKIKRAFIIIHGISRNADDYYLYGYEATQLARATDETIIMAPNFYIEEDQPDENIIYWENSERWKRGDLSSDNFEEKISSYAVMDLMLEQLNDKAKFPNLQEVFILGHSAGGQYVQRYAASSTFDPLLAAPIRYIPSNLSSFVYLDEKRLAGSDKLDEFAIPQTDCIGYDEYKYGLKDLNLYLTSTGATRIQEQYEKRDVVYLLGAEDSDPLDPILDVTCQAMLQGGNRLERGLIYFNYLEEYYGQAVHRLVLVAGVDHNGRGIITSAEARELVFGD